MVSINRMTYENFLTAIVILGFGIAVRYYLQRRRFFELGRKLPGPKPWPIIGNALDFLGSSSDVLLDILHKLTGQYQMAAVWFGPKLVVCINSPHYAEIFFTNPTLLDRTVKFLRRGLGRGLLTTNGAQWKGARKKIAPAFQFNCLRQFVVLFKRHSDILVERLQGEVNKGSFDVYSYLKNCTFDIVAESALEANYDSREEEANRVLQCVERAMELINLRAYKIWQHNDYVYRFSRDGIEFDEITAIARTLTKKEINHRKGEILRKLNKKVEDGARSSFLIQLHEECDEEELTDHIMTLLVAGYDTTANTLGFLLVMLALHPEIQDNAYQEAVEVYGALTEGQLDGEDLNKMQYLEMVVKETLRLYPAGPLVTRKVSEDLPMGKQIVPRNATLAVNIFEIHRDATSYEHPEKFNPDNFLPENILKRHPYSFIPFGGGPRMCVGYKFAMWTLKVIASSVLLHYKLECDYKMEDVELDWNIILKMKNGFNIRILKRH